MKMTKEQLAALLDGREYGSEITLAEERLARECGLVIVFGYSDDLMEFRGAINDEVGGYTRCTAYLDEKGLWINECEDEGCPYAAKEATKCKTITGTYGDLGWTYETDIPHATFYIYEDGALYCIGIVFEMAALAREATP